MSRTPLHDYDLRLCDYVRGTIASQMSGWRAVRPKAKATSRKDGTSGRQPPPDYLARFRGLSSPDLLAAWLKKNLKRKSWRYLADTAEPRSVILLNSEDFAELSKVLEDLAQTGLADGLCWIPWPFAHQGYIDCLPEIQKCLAKATADAFAKLSTNCIERLEEDGLALWEGVQIVEGWVRELRSFLAATGQQHLLPRPAGQFPSPHFPKVELILSGDDTGEPKPPPPLATGNPLQTWPPDQGWHFRPGEFAFKGKMGKAKGKPLELLKKLTSPTRAWEKDELFNALWLDSTPEEGVLRTYVSKVRNALREAFGLSKKVDPIPTVDRGRNLAWKVDEDLLIKSTENKRVFNAGCDKY